MKRKLLLLPFLAFAMLLALGSCSNEELLQESNPEITPGNGRTLSITASMPLEPATRVGLEQQADKSIALTWEVGDKLQLAFVQGATKVKQTVTLTADNITTDRKKATFNIEIPASFNGNENFDLYGVCGGGKATIGGSIGLPGAGETGGGGSLSMYYDGDALVLGDANTNPYVQLPYHAGGAKSLETVHFRKDVMLTFAAKDIDVNNPQISVVFNHLGSLFNITLKNTGTTTLENVEEAQLVGINNPDNQHWAYNTGMGGKTYDLITATFQDIESAGNYISLKPTTNSLAPGASTTFWAWYPPVPSKVWPELQLQLKDGTKPDATTWAISVDSKPARTGATAAGKAYYFYAKHNGTDLNFSDEAFVLPLGQDE